MSVKELSNYFSLPSDIPERSSFRLEKSIAAFKDSKEDGKEDLDAGDKLNWIFVNTIQHLYRSLIPSESLKGKEIDICGDIESDGLGDYFHLINDFEIIRHAYPQCPVTIIADFKNLKERVKNLYIPKEAAVLFIDTNIEDIDTEQVKTAFNILKKASVIIDAPYGKFSLFSKTNQKTIKKCIEEVSFIFPNRNRVLSFQELDAEPGLPDKYTWSLGFIDFHEGIFIKNPPENQSLKDLHDIDLKSFLFGSKLPCQGEILKYQELHHYHYGYIKSDEADSVTSQAFIVSCATLHAKSKKAAIDIILPRVDLAIDPYALKKLIKSNIASVQLYQKVDNNIVLKEEKIIAKEGKIIRIINPFPLVNEDCKLAAHLFEHPIGSTGDISLMETLSLSLPYYQAASHKVEILPSITQLIKSELTNQADTVLVKYFEKLDAISKVLHGDPGDECESLESSIENQSFVGIDSEGENDSDEEIEHVNKKFRSSKDEINSDKVEELSESEKICDLAEDIGNLLQDANLMTEMVAFRNLIKIRYNFNEVLKDLVERSFSRQELPQLANFEDELCEEFVSKKISLDDAYKKLKGRIEQHKPEF